MVDPIKGQKEQKRLKCRGSSELCTPDANFDFEFGDDSEVGSSGSVLTQWFTSIPVAELFGPKMDILLNVDQNVPLPIRPGDFNVDGYPDLLLTVTDGKTSTVKVLLNVPCSAGVAGCSNKHAASGGRGFVVAAGKGWEALEAITDAVGASWVDIGDDVSRNGDLVDARGPLTLWFSVLENRPSRLFRTTFTMTRSSSRLRVGDVLDKLAHHSAQRRVRSGLPAHRRLKAIFRKCGHLSQLTPGAWC